MEVEYEVFWGDQARLGGIDDLILVSANEAKSPMWQQALGELNKRQLMVRFIFDEGHQAFIADDFRNALKNLTELRQFPMQLVVLSCCSHN